MMSDLGLYDELNRIISKSQDLFTGFISTTVAYQFHGIFMLSKIHTQEPLSLILA